jgi:Putative lumazine-binding
VNRGGLGCFCLFLSCNVSTLAQASQTSADDSSAVRATVTNYIEAYYTGDPHRMEQTLHPHYLKHMIHGDIPMRDKTGPQMVQEVRSHGFLTFPERTARNRSWCSTSRERLLPPSS